MANIILTSYCNLHCPYCFANQMIQTEKQKNISIEQFKKVLKWIGDDEKHIGLIGGEPTLHPQFNEILNEIKEYSENRKNPVGFSLFTNGIYLEQYIQKLPQNLGILVNVNQPQAMTTSQYSSMIKNITIMGRLGWISGDNPKVTLGCNICQEIDDYSFFWNIVKRVHPNSVRFSVVAPTKREQLLNKDGYYELMKPKFLNFVNCAAEAGTHINPDCNIIPPCYFSEKELEWINSICEKHNPYYYPECQPVIDIAIDFTATSCFGCFQRVDCNNFENLQQLTRYMILKVMQPRIVNNNGGKCKDCPKFEFTKCQGGCLAFSKID